MADTNQEDYYDAEIGMDSDNEDPRGRVTTGEGEIDGLGLGEDGQGDNIDGDDSGPDYTYPEADEQYKRDDATETTYFENLTKESDVEERADLDDIEEEE